MELPGYYEFCCNVKTLSGHKALEQIPVALERLNAKKPMIITDKGVSGAGLVKLVQSALKKVKPGALGDTVPPDSDMHVVHDLAEIYRQKGCDSIIAIGGGSPMDTAKAVNICVSENSDDLMKFSGAYILKRKLRPLLAIPTTSGTGSEMTQVAVIADKEKNVKMVFTSPFLLPDVAVLDSRMTKTLPPFLTAATGMDAMTHAIEAYTSLAKNPISDSFAVTAIQLISQNILQAVKKPGDLKARLALANGSALAGIAFSNSMVAMVHTIGHAAGGVCHVPHANCMSILLPYGLEYNLHKNAHLTAELLFATSGPDTYAATPKKDRAEKVIAFVRQMNEDLHEATAGRHPRFFKEVMNREGQPQVPREKLPDIARTAMGDGSQVFNPEDLDYDDFMMVLEHAWEGTPLDRKKIKKG